MLTAPGRRRLESDCQSKPGGVATGLRPDDGVPLSLKPLISREMIRSIPATPYSSFRPYLQSGDLLFCSVRSGFSRVVQAATGSPWSHVGIVIRVEAMDRVMVLESLEVVGIRMKPLSHYAEQGLSGLPFQGELVVARHREIEPQSSATRALIEYGMSLMDKPHSQMEVAGIALRLGLGFGSVTDRRRRFLSAEFVDACFSHERGAALKPFHRANNRLVTPADLWADPRMMPLRRLLPA